jgi:uncharacterized protein (TIRG00374 family)
MKKWLGFALKAGLSVGILALIAARTDLRAMFSSLASIDGGVVALVLVLIILQTVVAAYRWVVIMRGVGVALDLWPALQALLVSLLFNQCLPSYVGGDSYRVYWLSGHQGHRVALALRGVLIDRVSTLVGLVAMLGVSLPLLFERFHNATVEKGLLAALICGAIGTVGFFTCDLVLRRWRRVRVLAELAEVSTSARRLLFTASGLLVGLLVIVGHILTAAVMFAFAHGLGMRLTLLDCVLLMPPIFLLAAVPISVGGWGVREGVLIGTLALLGIGAEPAFALSVLLGLALLVNGLIGLLPLAFNGRGFLMSRSAPAPQSEAGGRIG